MGFRSPQVPDIAVVSTLSDNFFEESTANVFVHFVAVNVLFTELDVMRRRSSQTIQSVGKEVSAYLQRSHINTWKDILFLN